MVKVVKCVFIIHGNFLSPQEEEEKDPEMLDPSVLTDDKLKTTLLKYGVEAGPIVGEIIPRLLCLQTVYLSILLYNVFSSNICVIATTRSIYERKLQRLLKPAQPRQNGGTGDADQYSDSEGEEETGMIIKM